MTTVWYDTIFGAIAESVEAEKMVKGSVEFDPVQSKPGCIYMHQYICTALSKYALFTLPCSDGLHFVVEDAWELNHK